ncbi:hypothetical protein GCM10011578_013930 [Streptomyces fuscichromogenes]|uniref:FXSXX-COOH protein n=2 Tax=Streptomyces fuscichromogenes TaxID=1324013 RepID=A0A917UJU5_9ACTN|nr:hypothetical protein GCM10011578_013930 [Streptomyces fuscichromogenes]
MLSKTPIRVTSPTVEPAARRKPLADIDPYGIAAAHIAGRVTDAADPRSGQSNAFNSHL